MSESGSERGGLDLAQMRAHLFYVHDAHVTKLANYMDVDRALADLGLARPSAGTSGDFRFREEPT